MKIINKINNYEYDNEYSDKEIFNISKLIIEFLNNKENCDKKIIFDLLSYFYDIKADLNDYMEYINSKSEILFDEIIDIPTTKVIMESGSEGHGRDFSWWTQNYQIFIKVFSHGFNFSSEEYTMEEVNNLVLSGDIVPIYSFGEKTRKSFNNEKESFSYLTKYAGKKIEESDEYFSFMVDKAINNIGIKTLIFEIRKFIIKLKLDSVYKRITYLEDTIETFDELSSDLISIYNESVKGSFIEKTPLDIVIAYLSKIQFEEKWYQEVTLEQIVSVFSEISYEENKDLCSLIEELVISIGEVELCYEMARNFDWVDKKIMGEIVIKDGSPDFNYYFASEVDGADIERHKQVIFNSKYTDQYILDRAIKL